MEMDFFFWWSIVSTLISVVLLCFSIWQFMAGQKQEERIKAQVKNWMHSANGMTEALRRIVADNLEGRFSTTNDVCNAIWSLQAMSFSLYQSLYEERCLTEREYKERQKRLFEKFEEQQEKDNTQISDTGLAVKKSKK